MDLITLSYKENLPVSLSQEETIDLFYKVYENDLEAREKLIIHNARLIKYIISKRFYDNRFEKNDLFSIGMIGLIKAVDTFDVGKKINFSVYATKCITNTIIMYIKKERKKFKNLSLQDVIYLDSDENEITREDKVDDKTVHFELDYENKDYDRMIREIVFNLPEIEKNIIIKHFGFLDGNCMSQQEIGTALGISQPNISRIIKRTLKKIKDELYQCSIIEDNPNLGSKNENNKRFQRSKPDLVKKINENDKIDIDYYDSMIIKKKLFKEMCSFLTFKEIVIISLKLGYVDDKYYSTDSIAKFLEISEKEILETIKKVLYFSKNSINNSIDTKENEFDIKDLEKKL